MYNIITLGLSKAVSVLVLASFVAIRCLLVNSFEKRILESKVVSPVGSAFQRTDVVLLYVQ